MQEIEEKKTEREQDKIVTSMKKKKWRENNGYFWMK